MKPSYYNVFVPLEREAEGGVLYNTRTCAIASLDAQECETYRKLCKGDAIQKERKEFVEALAEQGFVLDDPKTEANLMRYQFEKYRFDDTVFELYVAPTMWCNFNCTYCFEKKRRGRMNQDVQDSLLAFVNEQYEKRPFKELKIVWYGGEPLLHMEIIEALTKRFVEFCKQHSVTYIASIISNTALADEAMQQRMIDCNIWSVMTTIDGAEGLHEQYRVNRTGRDTTQMILGNVESMTKKGICVDFRCNLDKNNVESCLNLTGTMQHHDNLGIRVKPIRQVKNIKQDVPGAAQVNPLSPEEFSDASYRVFMQSNPQSADYERELRPLHLHCSACMDRGYAIDEKGNAFNCGCAIGDDKKILFNICEAPNQRKTRWDLISWYGSHNPLDIERCRTCRVLPLCQGGCLRIDEEPFSQCNPIKFSIEKLVLGYYHSLAAQ